MPKFGDNLMSIDTNNKRIYTLNRVFSILILAICALYFSESQVFSQEDAEVMEVSWSPEQQNEILDKISPTVIAEFAISHQWTGVEVLDEIFQWDAENHNHPGCQLI